MQSSSLRLKMECGTRVRIAGLTGRTALNGCEGEALYLVPQRERYLVKLDGTGEEIGVKSANLTACQHIEERSGDSTGLGETVTVNGLIYCAEHRMEICGSCSFDFRTMNRMRQLQPGDDVFERASAQDQAEAAKNEPPLRAPTRETVKPQTAPSGPALSKASHVEKGLDPSTLAAWPVGKKLSDRFQDCFSFREKMMNSMGEKPRAEDDPLYHVRESLYAMSDRMDECTRKKLPFPRFSVQDEAQSEVIMIDVVDVKTGPTGWADFGAVDASLEPPKTEVPLFVVRYAYYTSGNMKTFVDSMPASMQMKTDFDRRNGFTLAQAKAAGFQNMPSHLKEIAIIRSLLETNRKRLLPAFVERMAEGLPECWKVSALQPVSKDADAAPLSKEVCSKCGKEGEKLLNCARCKVQKYCSKECQVADWKAHKKTCQAPEKAANADVISVKMADAGFQSLPGMSKEKTDRLGGMHTWTINHDAAAASSMGSHHNLGPAEVMTTSSLPPDAIFVIKIQVPMPGMGPGMGMMVYDQTRKLHTQIHSGCMAPADYQRLDGIIRRLQYANGMKGYFNAYLDKRGDLHILADKPLPLQPW